MNAYDLRDDLFYTLERELNCTPLWDYDSPDVALIDPETDDVLGIGESETEALEDALKTVRSWKK
jgi:hypothetical protein